MIEIIDNTAERNIDNRFIALYTSALCRELTLILSQSVDVSETTKSNLDAAITALDNVVDGINLEESENYE